MRFRAVQIILCAGAALCLFIAFAVAQDSPSPQERAKFFADVKSARLVSGEVVNCCGEGDGVKVRMLEYDVALGLAKAQIIDKMKSWNGNVGDVITIPLGKNTVNIHNPFDTPIAFIRSDNSPICLAGNGGY